MALSYYLHRAFIVPAIGLLTCAAATATAQITLTQASYATWTLGLDSTRPISAITVSPSNNATWDLSGGTYGTPISSFTRTAVSGNATFPSATYSLPVTYSFNSVLAYQATQMRGLVSAGILSYGEVVARQPISLMTLTGGANDSLVFNQQNIVNTSPEKVLAFPATAASTWGSNFVWDLGFNLTVAAYALNNTPGLKRAYVTEVDSVKGWGKMRVQNVAGQNTAYIDVLAVKVGFQQRDSFFLNGVPAPGALVTAFGLTQGQLSTNYYINYYRAGEAQPLLTLGYPDNTYTTPSSSTVHAARLAGATSVLQIALDGKVKVFPNPVTNGLLHISITNPDKGDYSYELTSAIGQKLASAPLNLSKGNADITLDQPAGIYFLNILSRTQSIGVQELHVQ